MMSNGIANHVKFPDKPIWCIQLRVKNYHCVHFIVSRCPNCTRFTLKFFFSKDIMDTIEQG